MSRVKYVSVISDMDSDMVLVDKKKIEGYKEFIRNLDDTVWEKISSQPQSSKLTEDFIREFQDKIDWDKLSASYPFSEDFIREFKDRVNWISISHHQKLSEDFIREFQDKVDWYCISKFRVLSDEFIEEFIEEMSAYRLLTYQTGMSEETLKKVKERLYPKSQKKKMPIKINYKSSNGEKETYINESVLKGFLDLFDWEEISRYDNLDVKYIRLFQDYVDWDIISIHQDLTEDFIREFIDKLNLHYVYKYQYNISDEFRNWLYHEVIQKKSIKERN